MNIVIVGVGNIGFHLASLLSKLEHNVIVIEKDEKKLEEAKRSLDVAGRLGSGTDWKLLEELSELPCDLLLAVTDHDETNLTISAIAKYLNIPQTVARVRQSKFINCERLDFGRIFHVDYLISPELIVAMELFKIISCKEPDKVYNFAHGAVQTRTFTIPPYFKKQNIILAKLDIPENVKIALINRKGSIIFPKGQDVILEGDEVTCIGERKGVEEIPFFFSVEETKIKNVVIGGGSQIGFFLAQILQEEGMQVKLIEKDFNQCDTLSINLPECTILHFDATDPSILEQEKVMNADLFIAVTTNDAENLLMAKLAKNLGVKRTLMVLKNRQYSTLAEESGVDNWVFLNDSIENRILNIVNANKLASKIYLYEESAELLEIKVTNSMMCGVPIADLAKYLPKDFLIAAIKNRGHILIANGSRILSPGDTVIAITHPRHTQMLYDLF